LETQGNSIWINCDSQAAIVMVVGDM